MAVEKVFPSILFIQLFSVTNKSKTSKFLIYVNSVSVQTVGNPNGSSPYCHGDTSGSTFSGSGINTGRKTCARVIIKETDHWNMEVSIPQTCGVNSVYQYSCIMLT